jgi:hypothetical protein
MLYIKDINMEELDKTHIKIQFTSLGISILAFLFLILEVGSILWFENFSKALIPVTGGLLLILGILFIYKDSKKLLTLGISCINIGIINLVLGISFYEVLKLSLVQNFLPISNLLIVISLSITWFFLKKRENIKISPMILTIAFLIIYWCIFLDMILNSMGLSSMYILVALILSILLGLFLIVKILYSKSWLYSNLSFWIVFSLSFLILSQIVCLPIWGISMENMINLVLTSNFFASCGLLVGVVNDIYEKKLKLKA